MVNASSLTFEFNAICRKNNLSKGIIMCLLLYRDERNLASKPRLHILHVILQAVRMLLFRFV